MVNRFGIKNVIVVKDEDERVFYGSNVIEQGRQNRYGWRWLRRLERTQHAFSNSRRNRLQSSDEVRQKACGVVIPFVQRQPGGTGPRSLDSLDPFTDQRGFPKASGGRDERQFAVQPLVQPLEQAGAADNVRSKPREIQFRSENWRHLLSPPTAGSTISLPPALAVDEAFQREIPSLDEGRNFQRSGTVYQMWSVLPRHVHTSAGQSHLNVKRRELYDKS